MTDRTDSDLPETVDALLREEAVWAEVDQEVLEGAVEAVLAERQHDDSRLRGPVGDVVDLAARRSARRQGMLLGAAAASLLLAFGFVVGEALNGGDDVSDVTIALQATELEPAASGDVELTATPDGTRIVIRTSDLPPAPDGTYYEAWLRTGPDFGVSAGTFHLRGGGDVDIELWAGVSVDDFPLFTVTIQPIGLDESSGRVVLAGRIDS